MKNLKSILMIVLIFCLYAVACGPVMGEAAADPFPALLAEIPEDFTSFEFENCQREADVLSHYMWYFFDNRMGYYMNLFNKEYMLASDMWLGGGFVESRGKTAQEIRREQLLAMLFDQEGCVQVHQHYSYSQDEGWPFPLWTQADFGPEKVAGQAAGWHFQDVNDVPHWVGDYMRGWRIDKYYGETAAKRFTLVNIESKGITAGDFKLPGTDAAKPSGEDVPMNIAGWHLVSTGVSPAIITPDDQGINPDNISYVQIRWKRTGTPKGHAMPYVEWKRQGDGDFSSERRMYFYLDHTDLSGQGIYHSMIPLYLHPQWNGQIKQLKFSLAPGESDVEFKVDSIFCHYDTRHSINNPIYIMAATRYFNWSGDLDFLRQMVNKMRLALRYQQTVMGGLEFNHIRNQWPGHDGLPGWVRDEEGKAVIRGGHGIGNNYYDLIPFGWDDMYATSQYYASTLDMAVIEEAIRENPSWAMPKGVFAFDAEELRKHAAQVKKTANKKFWNPETERFYGWIDKNGRKYDYGFTFVNQDAIWYGIATDEHAKKIMEWLNGDRIVEGDTSTGKDDIYHWRFGPRATTKRNIEVYGQGWVMPESIPWGGQIQDGGAVLGFSFYDLWARLKVFGADDAWQRLTEITDWEREVWTAGSYRKYYEGGKQGTTLQGGGTAGGIGVDFEFLESSLLPCIVPYGFMGIEADPDKLLIKPNLPAACPQMTVKNLWYRNVHMDVTVSNSTIELDVKEDPIDPIQLSLEGKWQDENTKTTGSDFVIDKAGTYKFSKK